VVPHDVIADKAFASIKQTIRSLTPRRSPRSLADVINEVNATLRGWTYYLRNAIAGRRFFSCGTSPGGGS
jgi:RNA-directed DNA polymerase